MKEKKKNKNKMKEIGGRERSDGILSDSGDRRAVTPRVTQYLSGVAQEPPGWISFSKVNQILGLQEGAL